MVKPCFVHLVNATLVRTNPDRDKITFAGTSLLGTNKGLEVIDQASPDQRLRRELNSFITASMGFISAIYHTLLAHLHKKKGPACTNHQNGRRTDSEECSKGARFKIQRENEARMLVDSHLQSEAKCVQAC